MKKLVFVFVFILFVNEFIFAEDYLVPEMGNNTNNSIMVDMKLNTLIFLNFGISYEHRLMDHFSLFYHADIITLLVFRAMGFNTELHCRWYPLTEELNNLYVSLGIGYGRFINYNQLNITTRIGWKIIREGFITEPFIGYTYSPGGVSQYYLGIASGWSF